MIKSTLILVWIGLLSSCTTVPLDRNPDKKISVNNSSDAKHVIQNQLNFLKTMFTQSHDPYYNVPRWTEQCLRDNQIGTIQETDKAIYAISRLWLNESGSAGFCMGDPKARYSTQIYLFCKNSSFVAEYRIPATILINQDQLCP